MKGNKQKTECAHCYAPESDRSEVSCEAIDSTLVEILLMTALGGIGGGAVTPWLRGDRTGGAIFIES